MLKSIDIMMNSKLTSKNNDSSFTTPKRFSLTGQVVNNSLEKTVTVLVVNKFRHPIYQKTVSRSKKYLVHDAKNKCQIGDQVLIVNSRKISLKKSFYVAKIITSAQKKSKINLFETKTENK